MLNSRSRSNIQLFAASAKSPPFATLRRKAGPFGVPPFVFGAPADRARVAAEGGLAPVAVAGTGWEKPASRAENRHLERKRHPRARSRGAAVDRARISRRPLPPGDQGLAGARSRPALRSGGLLVLLARLQRLFGRLPPSAQEHLSGTSPVHASGVRRGDAHRHRPARRSPSRFGLRPDR